MRPCTPKSSTRRGTQTLQIADNADAVAADALTPAPTTRAHYDPPRDPRSDNAPHPPSVPAKPRAPQALPPRRYRRPLSYRVAYQTHLDLHSLQPPPEPLRSLQSEHLGSSARAGPSRNPQTQSPHRPLAPAGARHVPFRPPSSGRPQPAARRDIPKKGVPSSGGTPKKRRDGEAGLHLKRIARPQRPEPSDLTPAPVAETRVEGG